MDCVPSASPGSSPTMTGWRLYDHILTGLVRIITNRRIVPTPAPTAPALEFVARTPYRSPSPVAPTGHAPWGRLHMLVDQDRGIAGNVVPDPHLAAVALTHGCRLATADRGFARSPASTGSTPPPEPRA